LAAPLDVVVVRKLGVPWQPELAMGAIASGSFQTLNEELIAELGFCQRRLTRSWRANDSSLLGGKRCTARADRLWTHRAR
jgi:predicted phosphoribosyltransferase